MDPVSAIIGLGISAVGTFMGMSAANEQNEAQKKQIQGEQLVEGQRQQAATLLHEAKQMQILRNNQRARAMGLEAATSQGAQYGSGLSGAYGQIRGASGVELLQENQNYEIGMNVFGINRQISDFKVDQANAQKDMQMAQGISSFGNSIFGASKSVGNLTSGGVTNAAPTPTFGMGLPRGNSTGSRY